MQQFRAIIEFQTCFEIIRKIDCKTVNLINEGILSIKEKRGDKICFSINCLTFFCTSCSLFGTWFSPNLQWNYSWLHSKRITITNVSIAIIQKVSNLMNDLPPKIWKYETHLKDLSKNFEKIELNQAW
jgi:IS30 family transposase